MPPLPPSHPGSALEVLSAFMRLGLTSFGGPTAHLGFFRTEFVERRRWLSDAQYADLVALAQFLPGPASSQVGLSLGYLRAGLWGALAAWAGFTLPSAALMVGLALGVQHLPPGGWLSGLKVAAVAVVAQAVGGMWSGLISTRLQAGLALAVAAALTLWPVAGLQVGALLLCAAVGWRWLPGQAGAAQLSVSLSHRAGATLLALALALLLVLPLLAGLGPVWALLDITYRAGALVFGGGHVVLPLLQTGFVPQWMTSTQFIAGYGAANAVPGPLFTFASYLGAAAPTGLGPWAGAAAATIGIFLPGALLMLGALPFWSALAARPGMRRALSGLNAGVVGLLLAALYDPVFRSGVSGSPEFALALLAYAGLTAARLPAWAVVGLCAAAGWLWL